MRSIFFLIFLLSTRALYAGEMSLETNGPSELPSTLFSSDSCQETGTGAEVKQCYQSKVFETKIAQKYCCKVCRKGQACGDSCISWSKTCHQPPGCACQG